jgi:hypothetical protein
MAVYIKISLLRCDTIQSGVKIQRNIFTRLHGDIPEHRSISSHIYITTTASIASIYAFWKLKQLSTMRQIYMLQRPFLFSLMSAFVRTSCAKYCTFPSTHNSGQALSSQSLLHTKHCKCHVISWQIQASYVIKLPHFDAQSTERLCKYPHNSVKQVWSPDIGQCYNESSSDANDI